VQALIRFTLHSPSVVIAGGFFLIDQSVRNGQFRERQIIGAAMIKRSARAERTGPNPPLYPALRGPGPPPHGVAGAFFVRLRRKRQNVMAITAISREPT
jgi:hypothetical protein